MTGICEIREVDISPVYIPPENFVEAVQGMVKMYMFERITEQLACTLNMQYESLKHNYEMRMEETTPMACVVEKGVGTIYVVTEDDYNSMSEDDERRKLKRIF
jgi:hypothetical protein